MKCPFCASYVEPKDNWRSILVAFIFALLMGFLGGLFFSDWKMVSKLDKQIEKDNRIKKDLRDNFVPSRPEPKKKG